MTEIRAAIERTADVREGYRRFGVGSRLQFSVESSAGMDVIRILHPRTNPTPHLRAGPRTRESALPSPYLPLTARSRTRATVGP